MSTGTITPGDVSLLARETHAVLQAAEIMDGQAKIQLPLYWAAERLANSLVKMTEGLEAGKTHEEIYLVPATDEGQEKAE